MKPSIFPRCKAGWFTIIAVGISLLMLGIFFLLNAVIPDTSGSGFWDFPHLAIPLLAGWLAGLAGVGTGSFALIIKRDVSVVAILALLADGFIAFWGFAEALSGMIVI